MCSSALFFTSPHRLCLLYPSLGNKNWNLSEITLAERQLTSLHRPPAHCWLTQKEWDRQLPKQTFTSVTNLESGINLTSISLESGRKPDYSKKIHWGTQRTCTFLTETLQSSIKIHPLFEDCDNEVEAIGVFFCDTLLVLELLK